MAYMYDNPLSGTRHRPPTNAGYPPNPFGGQAAPRPNTAVSRPNTKDPNGTGGGRPPQGEYPPTQPEPPAASPYHFDWLSPGYSREKLNNADHLSAKYQIGRTLSQFDPHGGVSDPVLQALNALGFGTFYGEGQNLGLKGVTSKGHDAGLDTHDYYGDFIRSFHGDNPLWGYAAYADPFSAAASAPAPTDPYAGFDGGFAETPDPTFQFSFPVTMPQQDSGGSAMNQQMLDTLAQITANAQSTQQAAMPVSTGPRAEAPPLMLSPDGNALRRAMQVLAMTPSRGDRPTSDDPFMRWLMTILGGA